MVRLLGVLVLTSLALVASARADGPTADELSKRPITTDRGEIGKLLTAWWKGGTAAGNAGDWYDNRDGEHSPLDLRPWPQLQKVAYTPADVKARRHWALMLRARPHVTFGNSSTSGPPQANGSNPRTAYSSPLAMALLHKQYRGHNLYIYPEHRDHDPGHNGPDEGFGDLYPTNTPYLLISQGSSGSDQPFMRALPYTLAAFRPDVKKKLVEVGLLMPAVQMIFRASNKHLKGPNEYLTGKAHPTVFEGAWVDPLKMVKMAHGIELKTIPPLAQIKVVDEEKPVYGRDYFEPSGLTEKLADTPCVVARIWRGKEGRRKLVVSAEDSLDVNKRPLTYHWVVLRGDAEKVKVRPRNKSGSEAEVEVSYHARRPVAPGSPLESNRVDIGVFVHNGAYYSPPAFLTFYSLDSEARSYDQKGLIREIGYGAGVASLDVTDHAALCEALGGEGPGARLLKLTPGQRKALAGASKGLKEAQGALVRAQEKARDAEATRNKAAAALRVAEGKVKEAAKKLAADLTVQNKQLLQLAEVDRSLAQKERDLAEKHVGPAHRSVNDARAALNRLLDAREPGLEASPRAFFQRALREAIQRPGLARSGELAALWKSAAPNRKAAVGAARQRLIALGMADKGDGPAAPLHLLGKEPTPFERAQLEYYRAALLAELALPGLTRARWVENHVDGRLTVRKDWRDVYRYDEAGNLLGWRRYAGGKVTDFTPDGLLVLKKDGRGRPTKARTVVYRLVTPYNPFAPNRPPLKQELGDEVVTIGYDGDRPRESSREKVKE
jgi:hypothetical protein